MRAPHYYYYYYYYFLHFREERTFFVASAHSPAEPAEVSGGIGFSEVSGARIVLLG